MGIMSLLTVFILCNLCILISSQSLSKDFHYIGSIKTKNPSFVELLDLSSSHSTKPLDLDLVVTNFAERGTNGISSFNNIGRFIGNISNGQTPRETALADKTLTWYLAAYPIYLHIYALSMYCTNLGLISCTLRMTASFLQRLRWSFTTGSFLLDIFTAESISSCSKTLNPLAR